VAYAEFRRPTVVATASRESSCVIGIAL
jgi:hypothetical protein